MSTIFSLSVRIIGLQHVDHLRDVGHAHSVGVARKDVQVQRGQNCVSQAVLLHQESPDCCRAMAHTRRPIHPPTRATFFCGSYLSMIADCLVIRSSISRVSLRN